MLNLLFAIFIIANIKRQKLLKNYIKSNYEKNVPAVESKKKNHSWVQIKNENQRWPKAHQKETGQKKKAPICFFNNEEKKKIVFS